MISYTPPLMTSASSRKSGPPSSKSHAAPVVDISRSVAAKIIVPPTRSIGTRGIPATIALFSTVNRAVSMRLGETNEITEQPDHKPVKNGWMTATRIFFCANGRANDRVIPKTPHFVAEYIGPVAAGCHEATLTFRDRPTEATKEPTHRAQQYYGFQCVLWLSLKLQKVYSQVRS